MAVVLLALGSRGDAQPMAVLGGALAQQGTDATVVALRDYADLVERQGARFVPIEAGIADPVESTRGGLGRLAVRHPAGQGWLLADWTRRIAPLVADAVLAAVRPGDTVLSGVLTRPVADALAEGRGCRAATLLFTAQAPTLQRESHFFARYFTRFQPWNRWGVGFNWRVATGLGTAVGAEVRRRLGLPRGPRVDAAHAAILAASPTLVPPAPDWPAWHHQTGFLAAPERPFTPDSALAAFLAGGEAPVFVGFGSMAGSLGHRSLATIVEAADRAGVRVVTPVVPGDAPGEAAPGVFATGPVPHGWLFGVMAGVVHHGGAGTTHDGLRSGRPSLAIPFGVDQPYHAWRLERLGVGPAPVPITRLRPDRLATRLGELVGTPAYARRAAEVGEAVRAEDGVGATLALLDRLGLT